MQYIGVALAILLLYAALWPEDAGNTYGIFIKTFMEVVDK